MLTLLVLTGAAQGRPLREDTWSDRDEGALLCHLSKGDGCTKLRLAGTAGTLITARSVTLVGGFEGSLTGALSSRTELGVRVVGLAAATPELPSFLGSGEVLLRLGQPIAPYQWLWLNLSAGLSLAPLPNGFVLTPSATVGGSYEAIFLPELLGGFVGVGVSVLWPGEWGLMPLINAGLIF